MRTVLLPLVFCICLAGSALGTTLMANLTADDEFSLYVSTDDTQLGTLIGSGSDWRTPCTLTAALTPGVTNYLHVVAADRNGYFAGFLGDFTISDPAFRFANGTQSLLTGSAYWSISNSGFGAGYYTPDELGVNGDLPWGPLPAISSSASWIWSDEDLFSTRYFSAAIIPATGVTANLTADDEFSLYLSTDDTQLGTLIGSGSDWRTPCTLTAALTPGVTNYLHVVAADRNGYIAGFLGDFTISDPAFRFANGTQSLLTGSAYWSISNSGFGVGYYTPNELGVNGDLPWGPLPAISSSASWIWSDEGVDLSTRYFSAAIVPVTGVTANLTADDEFNLYVSTDDTQLGTLIGSGSDWRMPCTLTAALTPGVTNYLHVVAADRNGYFAGFLGDFTISDPAFRFANGTQSLLTGSAYWSISNSGFGVGYYTPNELGVNGNWPWGLLSGISSSASWIWSDAGLDLSTRYFSAAIVPLTTVTANLTADDEFSLYLSTDDTQLGTLIGSGSDWRTPSALTAALTPGVTNYLHVVAADRNGYIAGFLGDFTISDPAFRFANGTQSLLTGSAYWSISNSGFGVGYYTPNELGVNGVWPWGLLSGISPSASWIWSDAEGHDFATRYFSVEIVPQ